MIFILIAKPFDTKLMNRMEGANDIAFLGIVYTIYGFVGNENNR